MFSPTFHLSLIKVLALGQTATALSVTEDMEPGRTDASCSRSPRAQAGGGRAEPSAGAPVRVGQGSLLEVGVETVQVRCLPSPAGNPPTILLGLGGHTGSVDPLPRLAARAGFQDGRCQWVKTGGSGQHSPASAV